MLASEGGRAEAGVEERVSEASYLGEVPMFGGCTAEQLDEIARLGEVIRVREGDDVVREGDPGDALYVIVSGRAAVLRAGRRVAGLEPGDYFGELSLFDAEPRSATVSAVEDLSCIRLTHDALDRVLEMPAIRDALLHGMARRIREFDRRAYWSR
jgi:CRP-like cAMP-binding protein